MPEEEAVAVGDLEVVDRLGKALDGHPMEAGPLRVDITCHRTADRLCVEGRSYSPLRLLGGDMLTISDTVADTAEDARVATGHTDRQAR